MTFRITFSDTDEKGNYRVADVRKYLLKSEEEVEESSNT